MADISAKGYAGSDVRRVVVRFRNVGAVIEADSLDPADQRVMLTLDREHAQQMVDAVTGVLDRFVAEDADAIHAELLRQGIRLADG